MLPFFSYIPFALLLCLPTRTVSDPLTELTADVQNNTWRHFANFVGAGKGSQVEGLSELKKYFQHFGYLSSSKANFSDVFDEDFESAVVSYQSNFGLQATGNLDIDTIRVIMSPRCGMSDKISRIHVTERYAHFSGEPKWLKQSPMTLTYAFSPEHMIDYISLCEINEVFKTAFSRWSEVIPVNFTEEKNYTSANIKIGFYRGDHGDGYKFDGVLGILAHGFAPENGGLHLDIAETWAVDFDSEKSTSAVDLESVATHEIGHVLGLAHSLVEEAIMFPTLRARTKKVNLQMDDVVGVQALYGSNPDFNLSSLQSETSSSSWAICLDTRSSKGIVLLFLLICMLLLSL